MANANAQVLLQRGTDPFSARFEDLEGRLAFTMEQVDHIPNTVLQLRREPPWALQHPGVMGPRAAFFYFGPARSPGYIVFGNAEARGMRGLLWAKRRSSTSRYFTSQSGREMKWKMSGARMECMDGSKTLAVYEPDQVSTEFAAILTIQASGLAVVTEIVATLMLARIAKVLQW